MIVEKCNDCDWEAEWEGGCASKDPGIAHVYITDHTVSSHVKD